MGRHNADKKENTFRIYFKKCKWNTDPITRNMGMYNNNKYERI